MTEINAEDQTNTTINTAIEMGMDADMAEGTTATTIATTTPTLKSPRTRTLMRAAEMEADVDDVDMGVDVEVGVDDVDSITQELAPPEAAAEATAEAKASTAKEEEKEELDHSKPFKIKDVTRHIRKALVATTLAELRSKVAVRFQRAQPAIHLDCDGTEIDDEEYFSTLEPNAELIAVFPGEQWRDPSDYNASLRRNSLDVHRLHKLVGQLQQNILNDADMDTLSNMDPNSLVDITGRELKESDYCMQSEAVSC